MAFPARTIMRRLAPACALMAGLPALALADEMRAGMGQPVPWQIGLQGAASDTMEYSVWFHSYVMWFIVPITLFVLGLLGYIAFKFNAKANPVPSKTTHNTLIEVVWTVAPIIILVFIAIPSFKLLYMQQVIPPDFAMTVKVKGNQWNWDYEYPDNGGISFNSAILPVDLPEAVHAPDPKDVQRRPDQSRLLTVDNEMVVPVGKKIRVQVTGTDVIHSFAVPSFGIKIDAIPGRLNETWFEATREGWFYGQCSELCGTLHAYMPIVVHVVSGTEFADWTKKKTAELNGKNTNMVASAAPTAQ